MNDNCILIDDKLYEIHCIECDIVLGLLEINNFHSQPYLCENCGIIINQQKELEILNNI